MLMTRLVLGLCLVLVACASNGPTEPGGDDVQPVEGAWSYSDTPKTNTCPGDVDTQEAGLFAIDGVTSSGFTIVPNDSTDPFTCSLSSDGRFNCPDRVKDVEDLRPDFDAVITIHASATGSFDSPQSGAGSQNANASCEGADCDAAGNVFPCSASVDFTIHAE
jgi:hypothetical protein